MGEVYRARNTKLQRDVALKVRLSVLTGESARARLVREARLAASLNHPAICTVHDVDDDDGRVYVVMELVAGRPLSEVIPKEGLPADLALGYGEQIAASSRSTVGSTRRRPTFSRARRPTSSRLCARFSWRIRCFTWAARPRRKRPWRATCTRTLRTSVA